MTTLKIGHVYKLNENYDKRGSDNTQRNKPFYIKGTNLESKTLPPYFSKDRWDIPPLTHTLV